MSRETVPVSHIAPIPNPEAHLAQWQIFVNDFIVAAHDLKYRNSRKPIVGSFGMAQVLSRG